MRLLEMYPERRTVVVNTRTKLAFRGVLWQRRREFLVLRNVEMLRPHGETVAMDGEVVIMRDNVDFIQVV